MTSDETAPKLLTDPDELLFRQVPSAWMDDGVSSNQAFRPTRKDEGQMSIARGSLTTAEDVYKHYTAVMNLDSVGTWALTVGEAGAAGLQSFDHHRADIPAHGFIDFRDLSRRNAERKSMILGPHARERGRLYP